MTDAPIEKGKQPTSKPKSMYDRIRLGGLLYNSDPEKLSLATIKRNKEDKPAVKHGIRSVKAGNPLPCNVKCCFVDGDRTECEHAGEYGLKGGCIKLKEIIDNERQRIYHLGWIKEHHVVQVEFYLDALADFEAAKAQYMRRLASLGVVGKDDAALYAYKMKNKAVSVAARLGATLGLNPDAQAKLGLTLAQGESVIEGLEASKNMKGKG